jgi:PAS domain S-box-containing protein
MRNRSATTKAPGAAFAATPGHFESQAMTAPAAPLEELLETADLAVALESDRFKQFLDQVPVAIAVSELGPEERIVYANVEFQRLTGQAAERMIGASWDQLPGVAIEPDDTRQLGASVTEERDYIGAFRIPNADTETAVDAWSNVIEDDDGAPVFRLVALVELLHREAIDRAELEQRIEEKDVQLRELQHRVKNNLQMITSLIRVEARGLSDDATGERFDRLAGRVEALGLLYWTLTEGESRDAIDLGTYLSGIATAVMRAHAVEGIHLSLQVDSWPVSINVAMPAGLVVNELLTNALKHAFAGREGGTISLHCLSEAGGCRVTVADDGVGLPPGVEWPGSGKLSALIVRSLIQNAKARLDVASTPGEGMKVTIFFASADAAPELAAAAG